MDAEYANFLGNAEALMVSAVARGLVRFGVEGQ